MKWFGVALAFFASVASAQSVYVPYTQPIWYSTPSAPSGWWETQCNADEAQRSWKGGWDYASTNIRMATTTKAMLLPFNPMMDTSAGDAKLLQAMGVLANGVAASSLAQTKYDWAVYYAMGYDVPNAIAYFTGAASDWYDAAEYADLAGGLACDAADAYRAAAR